MAYSNEGQDHKDKYFDNSRKILSQEMTMRNMEALVSYFQEVMTNVNFFFINWWNVKVKSLNTNKKILSQGIFMWNIKALALTFQKLLARLMFEKKISQDIRIKDVGYPQKGFATRNIHVKCINSFTHSLNVLSKVKVFKK